VASKKTVNDNLGLELEGTWLGGDPHPGLWTSSQNREPDLPEHAQFGIGWRSSRTLHTDDPWPQFLRSGRDLSLARHRCITAAHDHRAAWHEWRVVLEL